MFGATTNMLQLLYLRVTAVGDDSTLAQVSAFGKVFTSLNEKLIFQFFPVTWTCLTSQ